MHYIVSSLVIMSRGFAGSFGSAIGGGWFIRVLKHSLEQGFAEHHMPQSDSLIRQLLGSPAMVAQLEGTEREVAVHGYEQATRMLFMAGGIVAQIALLLQAGTGWKASYSNQSDEDVSES